MSQENTCTPAPFSLGGRRSKIRLIAFAVAALAVAAGFARMATLRMAAAETALSYAYRRSLTELADYVDNIDAALEKTLCSGTDSGTTIHAARVWRESAAAKACLSALPSQNGQLENTGKFLSQVGEYSYSLANRASAGQAITQEERDTLIKLSDYAASLRDNLHSLLDDLSAEGYETEQLLTRLGGEGEEGSFTQMEGSYEDYPSLIYDGPFSDHLLSGPLKMLDKAPTLSEEQAEERVKQWTDGRLTACTAMREGHIPVYVFQQGDEYLELTKQGGYVLQYSHDRDVMSTEYSIGEAVEAAENFLSEHGCTTMTDTYYMEDGHTLLINFAFKDGGAVCYPDLIKVRVAMDDLSVIGLEAAGYLANHTVRHKPDKQRSVAEALQSVSPYLTVEEGQMAFICPGGLTEYYVYEFVCRSETGRQVLVYVDAVTGREVDLLLLISTPGGTLTV